LFARLTLSGEELHLYQQIYDSLKPQAPKPDLVIYLQAQPEILYERVRRRGVEFERPITGNISPCSPTATAVSSTITARVPC